MLVLIAALVCLRLGWWQWNVTHEARGTIQNLGYALLWPVFAGAFIFMWLRFLYLEDGRRARQDDLDAAAEPGDPAPVTGPEPVVRAQPEAPARPDTAPEPTVAVTPAAAPPAADPEPSRPLGPDETGEQEPDGRPAEPGGRPRRSAPPSTAVTIAVATVGGDDEDDPELAAYNEALARLAEQDRRRAR